MGKGHFLSFLCVGRNAHLCQQRNRFVRSIQSLRAIIFSCQRYSERIIWNKINKWIWRRVCCPGPVTWWRVLKKGIFREASHSEWQHSGSVKQSILAITLRILHWSLSPRSKCLQITLIYETMYETCVKTGSHPSWWEPSIFFYYKNGSCLSEV